MQVEAGKRYLLVFTDGRPSCEGALCHDLSGALHFLPDDKRGSYSIDPDGNCSGFGALREIGPIPAPTHLRPIFGHDATEFERLQRVFRDWDFQQCT